ncbi:sugar kinase [Allopusillimonas ginsengisoli]|uniref:sugar kinase n=1 Tax=Allopusillimonas ginsengisoli TaxID=453575 RepID=UPI0039C0CFB5
MINKLDVVTFGEAMMLLVANEPGQLEDVDMFHKRTAGAETNVAIGLSRLGLKVGWASRLGDDSMARYLLRTMQSEGIDCSHVVCDAAQRTGFQFKGRVHDGSDPPYEYHRKGSAASLMQVSDIDSQWLCSARHLHATGVFAAISENCFELQRTAMTLMREAGRTVSFDPNLRPGLWASTQAMREGINQLASAAHWIFPGIDEGRLLTGHDRPEDIAAFYHQRGADVVVVKLGARGAFYSANDDSGYVPAFEVERVIDTVGAGDGFAVGVISALLEDAPLRRAVERGAWIGSRAVQVLGDTEGLPTRAELQAAF